MSLIWSADNNDEGEKNNIWYFDLQYSNNNLQSPMM